MNPNEMLMKYGGVGAVLISLVLLLAYVGMAFTGEGDKPRLEKLEKLKADIDGTLASKNFEEGQAPPAVPPYLNEIQKNWEKANLAQPASDFMVYPVLGVQLNAFDDPADKDRFIKSLTGRYLLVSESELPNFFGPVIKVTRGEAVGLIKATPAKMEKVEQTSLDGITIMWEDADPEMIEKSGVDEYQLFRYEGTNKNNVQRLTPAGYKEKIFVDKNFNPRTKYNYYVITKVKKVTPYEPPFPYEATPSASMSVDTQTDIGIIFMSVIGGGDSSFANVDVYKYHQGEWVKASFANVKRGDIIGKEKKVKVGGAELTLDFTTNYEVYEYYNDEERVVKTEGGKEVTIPRQARLVYFDKNEGGKKKEIWKFNSTYDKNPYEKEKPKKPKDDKDKDKDKDK